MTELIEIFNISFAHNQISLRVNQITTLKWLHFYGQFKKQKSNRFHAYHKNGDIFLLAH